MHENGKNYIVVFKAECHSLQNNIPQSFIWWIMIKGKHIISPIIIWACAVVVFSQTWLVLSHSYMDGAACVEIKCCCYPPGWQALARLHNCWFQSFLKLIVIRVMKWSEFGGWTGNAEVQISIQLMGAFITCLFSTTRSLKTALNLLFLCVSPQQSPCKVESSDLEQQNEVWVQ